MPKFRKKPVVVEAWPFNGSRASFDRFVAEAIGERVTISGTSKHGEPTVTFTTPSGALAQIILADDTIVLPTAEGDMEASPGDWIISGVAGELYPCKPEIFAETYWTADDEGKSASVVGCARCGGDHDGLAFKLFTRPFAPPEAGGIAWTHWAPCPTTGDPIMQMIAEPNPEARDLPGVGRRR